MSTQKEIKKDEKEIKKEEKTLVKEKKKVEKAINKDEKNIEKADKRIDTDITKGKADSQVTKDELKKIEAEGDLQKHVEAKKIIDSKLDNLGNTTVGWISQDGQGGVLHNGAIVMDKPVTSVSNTTTVTNTSSNRRGVRCTDQQPCRDRNCSFCNSQMNQSNQSSQFGQSNQSSQFSQSSQSNQSSQTGGKTVKVIEHVHPVQREENVIRHDAPVEKRRVVEREVIPNETVELHKHVHPVEKVDIHEHHKQRETEVVKEKVHQTHVKEVHEHSYPKTNVSVDKEVVHPEKRRETNKVVDLGEVSRDVVNRDVAGTRRTSGN